MWMSWGFIAQTLKFRLMNKGVFASVCGVCVCVWVCVCVDVWVGGGFLILSTT
jgi:hypothetical protein